MKRFALIAAIGFSLAACETTTDSSATQSATAPAWLSVVGKTLVNGETTVVLNRNGTLVGTGIEGVWEERDGKYCRTLTKPERLAGTECQVATVNGNEISFDNQKGRTSTWVIQ